MKMLQYIRFHESYLYYIKSQTPMLMLNLSNETSVTQIRMTHIYQHLFDTYFQQSSFPQQIYINIITF